MDKLEQRRKKLMFQCHYRGTKELDLVLGNFADIYLAQMTMEELCLLTDFLNEIDPDIYDWLSGRESLPPHLQNPVTKRLIAFGGQLLGETIL